MHRDSWGIPHLRAGDLIEVAFVQGRQVAEERAWQIEVERCRSLGVSAAFLGPTATAWDRFARQARLDATARRCFEALDGKTQHWLSAYVGGVNEDLDHGAEHAPEFERTGAVPGTWLPWTPLAIWLSLHVLFAGFPDKLWRERVRTRLGDAAIGHFASESAVAAGSNAWLVEGTRTTTGRPIIAGDPHRILEDPGVYQQIQLACPEFDVVGFAIPGIPGIAHFGHTGTVAWAITNAVADYQDLYDERLRRSGSTVEALGPDGWRPATSSVETIDVAGGAPVVVEIIETERGPVVIGGPDDERAISLRCPSYVTGRLGFEAIPALMRSRCVADVDRAWDSWVEPVNVVLAADVDGGVLHRTAGRVPWRDPENRLGVVPAWDRRNAWDGWHEPMPRADVDGVAVMANEGGIAAPLGTFFAAPHRARRIRELLDSTDPWTAKDMTSIHTDTHLGSADPLLYQLHRLDEPAPGRGLTPRAERLRRRLLAWDRRMDADSTDAAAYAGWRSELVRRLVEQPALAALREPARTSLFDPWLTLAPRVASAMTALLRDGAMSDREVDDLLADTLDSAAALVPEDTKARAGAPAPPTWGERHRLAVQDSTAPLNSTRVLDPDDADVVNPRLSGDSDCVLSTSSVPGVTDQCVRGPAARFVWDLGNRDDSLWVVPLGASGVPDDPHHHDQQGLWLRGDLLPVVTDWTRLTEDPP